MRNETTTPIRKDSVSDPLVLPATPVAPQFAFDLLSPALDATAGVILAACTLSGTPEQGRLVLAQARNDPACAVYGMTMNDELVAVYITRKDGLVIELTALAVAEGHRGKRYGRACVMDLLRRAGKRPIVVETNDDALGFYQAAGFKLVARRRLANNTIRYRLGLHAPRGEPSS